MLDARTIESQVNEVVEPIKERARDAAEEVKRRMAPVDQWLRDVARDQPMLARAGAVGVGYLLGRLIRRGR